MPEPDLSAPEDAIPEQILAEVWIYVGGELAQKYAIEHGEYIIGRDPSCPIVVNAEEVARHHARLTFNAFELVIEDLSEGHGLFIDGQPVLLPTRVRLDQEVQVGAARLFIRLKESAAKQLAAALWDKDLGLGPVRGQLEGKHYKVITTVNRGGMGVILQARDLRIRRTVAMKVMKTSTQFSRENVLRFIDEAQLTGQLEHPNIVPVYELGIDEQGETFYTMKFVKGITLDDVLRGIRHGTERIVQKYPLGTLLTIFQKVCDGVAFAHSKGVVHRDLKPENIMIGSFGEVLVMDWGLAKNITAGRRETAVETTAQAQAQASKFVDLRGFETLNGLIVGTPPYISPEQARGELDSIDPRTDIYVLGAILYTILTLRPPVEGESVHEVVEKILGSQIAPPSSFNGVTKADGSGSGVDQIVFHHCPGKRIPDGLSAVAMKALELDPAVRYQTVEDLQEDITAFQGGFAPKAERASVLKHGLLFAGRHKREMVLFSIFALLLLCAGVWFLVEVTREKNLAVANARIAEEKTQQLEGAMAELRGTAPMFFDDARMLAVQGRFEEALEKVDHAIRQIPNVADYHFLRGQILGAMWRWSDSAEAFEDALARNSQHKGAGDALELNERIVASLDDNGEPDKKLMSELRDRNRREGWKPDGDGQKGLRPQWMREKEPPGFAPADPSRAPTADGKQPPDRIPANRRFGGMSRLDERINRRPDGSWSVDLSRAPASEVAKFLQQAETRTDFTLGSLNLRSTGISDLSPLSQLPLKHLYLGNNPGVVNITPLAGMPLERLDLTGTRVSDLTPLGGSPIRELILEGCRAVTDLTPLAQCEKLETLIVPSQVRDLEFLRGKPGLMILGTSQPGRPVDTFWQEYDARQQAK